MCFRRHIDSKWYINVSCNMTYCVSAKRRIIRRSNTNTCEHVFVCALCTPWHYRASSRKFVMEPSQITCIFKWMRNLIVKIQQRVVHYIRLFNQAWRNLARACANVTRVHTIHAREVVYIASKCITTIPGPLHKCEWPWPQFSLSRRHLPLNIIIIL